MQKETYQHRRPLQHHPVSFDPEISRIAIVPEYEDYDVLIQPHQELKLEQAEQFLLGLSGLECPISWTIFVVNTGENTKFNSQFSVAPQDRNVLSWALKTYYEGMELIPGTNMYKVLLANILNNGDYYRQCGFGLYDFHCLRNNFLWSNRRLFGASGVLKMGEAIFQNIILYPDMEGESIASKFWVSIRYGIVARGEKKDKLQKALFGDENAFYTFSDYRRHGFSWAKIWDMLIRNKVYRQGFTIPIKQLSPFALLVWSTQGFKKAGISIRELQGNKPHPDLFTGIPVGYSLYDTTEQVICIPYKYIETSSIYTCGTLGSGKTTFIEHILSHLYRDATGRFSTLVLDYSHDLIDRLLGMFDPSKLDDAVYYDPVKSPFNCNIIQGHSPKEIVSFLARMVEARSDYSLSLNAAELIKWAVKAHSKCESPVTIRHLKAFIADEEYRKEIVRYNPDPEVADFIDNILPKIPDVSYAAALSKLGRFLEEPLFSSTCQSINCMDFPRLFSERKHVLANLSGLTFEEVADLGTILFTHASNAAFMKKYSTSDVKVRIVMDEFHTYYHMNLVDKGLNQGRKYNLALFLSHQSVFGQLDPKTIQNIAGAAKIRVCFRVKAQDALFMSSLFGVLPDELANLNMYEAYLQVDNYPAVKIRTLNPLQSNNDIRQQIITLSQEKFGGSTINRIDPYDLLKKERTTTQKRKGREYDEL